MSTPSRADASARTQLLPAVALGLVMAIGAWWYFWLAPARAANTALAERLRADTDRIAALQVQLARLRAADTTVPMLPVAAVVDRWAELVRALEASGLSVTQIEPAAPALPAPSASGTPPGSGSQQAAAAPSPVVIMRISLTFAGDYGTLRAAIAAVGAVVPATAWTSLDLSGQSGDGTINGKGTVEILALVSAAAK